MATVSSTTLTGRPRPTFPRWEEVVKSILSVGQCKITTISYLGLKGHRVWAGTVSTGLREIQSLLQCENNSRILKDSNSLFAGRQVGQGVSRSCATPIKGTFFKRSRSFFLFRTEVDYNTNYSVQCVGLLHRLFLSVYFY